MKRYYIMSLGEYGHREKSRGMFEEPKCKKYIVLVVPKPLNRQPRTKVEGDTLVLCETRCTPGAAKGTFL